MSYCTFWDHTIMHRFREYDDPVAADENIFNYVTSSNNRDGLAIKAAGYGLLQREEEKKILIILSDGRPYDVIINRPMQRIRRRIMVNMPLQIQLQRCAAQKPGSQCPGGICRRRKGSCGGKKIFGKDFAYIRDVGNFSRIVGRYLTKQLEADN